jgi:hypothetical protein
LSDDQDPDDGPVDLDKPPKNPNAATGAGVKAQREKRKSHDLLVQEFWQAVLADQIGRAEVWRILQSGGVFQPPFACGPNGFPQPEATWFKAGQHGLVLGEYHRLLRIAPDGVRLMLQEHDPAWKKAE